MKLSPWQAFVAIVPLLINIDIPVSANCGTNVKLKVLWYGDEWLLNIVKVVVLALELGKSFPEPESEKPVPMDG